MALQGRPLGIHALPEELLLLVFSGLELADRQRRLALCCRDWHRMVNSPALLRSVSARIPDTPAFMPRLRSLCQWLVRRAAPLMTQLQLQLTSSEPDAADWGDEGADCWRLDFTTTLVAALVACGTHGRLRDLCLELNVQCRVHVGSWMAPLASLQRLTVTLGDAVIISSGSLRCLTALQHLSLAAFPHSWDRGIDWQPGSLLPASLTSLSLVGHSGTSLLPPQITALPNLQQLVLNPYQELSEEEDDAVAWEQLRSLTALRISGFEARAPSCLDRLAQLPGPPARRLPVQQH